MGKKLTTQIFIERSSKIHNNKYDYTNSIYTRQYDTIDIKCPLHGIFSPVAKDHMSGYGCPQCGIIKNSNSRRKSTEQFISDCNIVHENRYDYSCTNYTGVFELVKIICLIHGEFVQRAHDHLNGCGCPSCTKSGYRSNQKGYIYIHHVHDDIYKLGITNHPDKRLEQINSKSEYIHTYFKLFSSNDGKKISLLERYILNQIPHGVVLKEDMKDGYTETFNKEHLEKVLEIIFLNNLDLEDI